MCLFTRCLLPIAIAAAVLFHTAPPGGATWRQQSAAADIFTDEQGTVPKDSSAFSESASEPVGPPEICSPTLPPADKDVQIAVRAFLQDAFCPGQLIKCQILKLAVRIFPETRRMVIKRVQQTEGPLALSVYQDRCLRLLTRYLSFLAGQFPHPPALQAGAVDAATEKEFCCRYLFDEHPGVRALPPERRSKWDAPDRGRKAGYTISGGPPPVGDLPVIASHTGAGNITGPFFVRMIPRDPPDAAAVAG